MNPEAARRVVRRRHDASAVWVASNHQRLRAELGRLELLDGGKEGVQVEVGEDHVDSATICTATNTA